MGECSRRGFLKGGGLALVSFGLAGGGPLFLGRAALAAAAPGVGRRRKVLVAIFQRGAMDGLAAVPPLGDRWLERLRPRLAMSAGGAAGEAALIDLGVGFGLHPALAPLYPLWADGRLGVVHAVGSPDPTRSHFDAQEYMESGTPGRKGTGSGWLNRVSGLLGHEPTPFRAMALGRSLPRSLSGPEPALAVADLAELRDNDAPPPDPGAVAAGDGPARRLLRSSAAEAHEAVRLLDRLDPAGYRPARGAVYPRSPLGDSLRQTAMLIKGGVGLEVAFCESGGWDTHVRQGTVGGSFAGRARDLAAAVVAFWTDLGAWRDDVVVMTMTEFGRTVRENGAAGTDHGRGSCLFLLGGAIDGGKVHGRFPGLAPELLEDGRDLAVTTDFRAVFAEVAARHLGVDEAAALFPGWSGRRLPLFRV